MQYSYRHLADRSRTGPDERQTPNYQSNATQHPPRRASVATLHTLHCTGSSFFDGPSSLNPRRKVERASIYRTSNAARARHVAPERSGRWCRVAQGHSNTPCYANHIQSVSFPSRLPSSSHVTFDFHVPCFIDPSCLYPFIYDAEVEPEDLALRGRTRMISFLMMLEEEQDGGLREMVDGRW